MWSTKILTLFPDLFPGPLQYSVVGSALKNKIFTIEAVDIRKYALDKHRTVDEPPYGGGSGMVLKPDVLGRAIEDVFLPTKNPILLLSPRGKVFTQSTAKELITCAGINILSGRFEGVDERIIKEYKIIELSMGDFVTSSGDVVCYSLIDACVRLLPSVLGDCVSLQEESFGLDSEYTHLLEYPHYTRPEIWKGMQVPSVLLSGNHQMIKEWKLKQAQKLTQIMRPDLWNRYLDERKK